MRDLPKQIMSKQHKKKFHKVRFWKVNLFNIFTSKNYDAIISQEDLMTYYEADIFKFYKERPNLQQPNLVNLLSDYIRNIYIFRGKVGNLLYWRLPQFKNPLDEDGKQTHVPPEHLFEMRLLQIYLKLQKKIDEQNK